MINLEKGEFLLQEPKLLIDPEFTVLDFISTGVVFVEGNSSERQGWKSYKFRGCIDGMDAVFRLFFKSEHIHIFSWQPSEAWNMNNGSANKLVKHSDKSKDVLRSNLNEWLVGVTNSRPPFEYNWGFITTLLDPDRDIPMVTVTFKRELFDRGIIDIDSFYKARRAYLGEENC